MKWPRGRSRASGGFDHNVLRDINALKEILQRYDGRSWFKELVQNADDAGATRLEIGWVHGLTGVRHPLLRGGPAVFVLNDGPFTAADAVAIHQLGLSDKSADKATIGRFGLGLKSIFHWCEAYFYLSSGHPSFSRSKGADDYPPDALFNPWSGPSKVAYHEDWDDFMEADRRRIRDYLGGLNLLGSAHWFCLWLPLRRRATCGAVHPIVGNYPGDADNAETRVLPEDLATELSILPPLLRHLSETRGWVDEGGQTGARLVFELRLDPLSTRLRYDGDHEAPFSEAWSGTILTSQVRATSRLDYVGVEQLLPGDVCPRNTGMSFDRLRDSEGWPKVFGPVDVATGRSEQEPVKAAPHAAVCLARRAAQPGRGGQLTIRWAAFLPVGEGHGEALADPRSDADFTLTLHGDFFIDAGRKHIDFANEPRTVPQQWNDVLRDAGTLPLILPTLEGYAASVDDSGESLGRLTAALAGTDLIRRYRDRICAGRQWVFRLIGSSGRWDLIPEDQEIYEIPPPPPHAPNLHVEVLPRLAEPLGAGRHVTFFDCPRICPTSSRATPWADDLIGSLLDVPVSGVFGDKVRLAYLIAFLESALDGRAPTPALIDRLCSLTCSALGTVGPGQLGRSHGTFDRLLALLPPDRRFRLEVTAIEVGAAEELIRRISGGRLHRVIVPLRSGQPGQEPWVLEPAHAPSGRRLGLEDAAKLMASLAGPHAERIPPRGRSGLACQVIAGLGEAVQDLDEQCDHFRLFLGRAHSGPDERLFSRQELSRARQQGLLFAGDDGLAGALQAALRDREVVTIEPRAAAVLFGRDRVRPCDARACLAALRADPPLADDPAPRIALLGASCGDLVDSPMGTDRQALRWLIHNRRDRREHEAILYAGAEPGLAPIWRRLAERALLASDGGWRVVEPEVHRRLNEIQQRALGIRRFDLDEVVRLLREVGPRRIDVLDLSDDDRRTVLRESSVAHADVVRDLAIHETLDGHFVPIGDQAYWQGNFRITGQLPGDVVLLRPSDDPVVAAKQRELHDRVLDAAWVIRIILERPECEQRWQTVHAALLALGELPRDLKDLLSSTRWIPIGPESSVAPEEVIRIVKPLDELIRDVLSAARPAPDAPRGVSVLSLPEPFHDHRAFEKIYPDQNSARNRGLSRLGDVLAGDERFRNGPFDPTTFDVGAFVRIFRDAPDGVMPCQSLIEGVWTKSSPEEFKSRLLPKLLGPVAPARMAQILDHLSRKHEHQPSDRHATRSWYDRYLGSAAAMPEFATILPRIRLLNQAGAWRRPEELSFKADGLAPAFLLDDLQGEIVADKVPRAHPRAHPAVADGTVEVAGEPDLDRRIGQGVVRLDEQAQGWARCPDVTREMIGGLLTLLGDDPRIRGLAEGYLGVIHIKPLREKLEWRPLLRGNQRWERGDVHSMMQDQEFVVEIVTSTTIPVLNLLGERVERPISEQFEHLLLGTDTLGFRQGGRRVNLLRLRAIDPGRLMVRAPMPAVFRETARRLLVGVYWQEVPNLDAVWAEISESDQLEVQVAQNLILKSIFAYVRQLGLHGRERVRSLLETWDRARSDEAQADVSLSRGRDLPNTRREAVKAMAQASGDLKSLLEGDPDTHHQFLEAVRAKIRRFQYDESSIPFELFQNADDAAVELGQMLSMTAAPEASRRFVVRADDVAVRFVHGGRAINRFRMGDFDGRGRGFDRDLEKMLMLSATDKAFSGVDHGTTGRFGLGFKSVFLASDAPRVLSGRLAFEVVAGLFPRALGGDERVALEGHLRDLSSNPGEGTIIELPLRRDGASVAMLGRFVSMAHLLVVFARQIRRCVVQLPGRGRVPVSWDDEPVPGVAGASVGTLRPIDDEAQRPTRALVLRHPAGALLLALDEGGFVRLPPDVPTVWVTAPTREEPGLGCVLNADFELDAGRARLATDSARNQEQADRLGMAQGDLFCHLFDAGLSDWVSLAGALGLGVDVGPVEFWESLWRVLGPPLVDASGPAADLLRRTLWGRLDRGLGLLIAERDALPCGLPGPYRSLTRLGRATHAAAGLLQDESAFVEVTSWPAFAREHGPGTVVAGPVRDALRRLLVDAPPDLRAVTLTDAVRGEVDPELTVDPGLANRLGRVVTPEFLRTLRRRQEEQDRNELLEWVKQLRFRARDGRWHPAVDLLIDDDDSEETMRARFAPQDRVLAPDYRDAGLEFFRACRPNQQMRAGVELLASWAVAADDAPRRKAVLDYLVGYELSQKLAEHLYEDFRDHWLKHLTPDSELFDRCDARRRQIILSQLGLLTASPPPKPDPAVRADAGSVLAAVYDWWMDHGPEGIRRYERLTYPDGGHPDWPVDDLDNDPQGRQGWFILLALGAMHTQGRTRSWQDSGFLRLCRDRGWLEVFTRPVHHGDEWLGVVECYLRDQVEQATYFEWMRHFVGFYQLSRWLDQYAQQFLALGRWQVTFSLAARLSSRADQASPADAPPLTSVLRTGACFVLRELARTGAIDRTNPHVHPHCYVPVRRTRYFLADLGCEGLDKVSQGLHERLAQSRVIHEFLCTHLGHDRAHFDYGFDLPLLAVAENSELRRKLLGDTRGRVEFDEDDRLEVEPW